MQNHGKYMIIISWPYNGVHQCVQKLENYEYILNILKQLDIENINITETMFNELNKFLNNENT